MEHIIIDRRWYSSIFNAQSYREFVRDNCHCLVVLTDREILEVNKRTLIWKVVMPEM